MVRLLWFLLVLLPKDIVAGVLMDRMYSIYN